MFGVGLKTCLTHPDALHLLKAFCTVMAGPTWIIKELHLSHLCFSGESHVNIVKLFRRAAAVIINAVFSHSRTFIHNGPYSMLG